jgi:hypothetical protein
MAGINLFIVDGQLKADAPKGALTDERRQKIQAHKADIIALLEAPVSVASTLNPWQHFLSLGDGWEGLGGITARFGPGLTGELMLAAQDWQQAARRRPEDAEGLAGAYRALWANVEARTHLSEVKT